MTLWEIDLHPAAGEPDLIGGPIAAEVADTGIGKIAVHGARGFLIQGELSEKQVHTLACELLADLVVERPVVGRVGDKRLLYPGGGEAVVGTLRVPSGDDGTRSVPTTVKQLIHVLPKPGVTDPVAESTLKAIADFGFQADAVCTLRKYWIDPLPPVKLEFLVKKLLANDSIERVILGPLTLTHIDLGAPYQFQPLILPLRDLTEDELLALSKARTLSLTLVEMQTIQQHYRSIGREPTDVELETIAQTWSEHCSHKTLAGQVEYQDETGTRHFGNLLKETIFAATQKIRRDLGELDWCVSVFKDNAGIVKFDDKFHVAFKVETHNRPSALEPYGGANTGVGGVIRDTLGTGLGAKPVCNTDVFCFAPPDMLSSELPPGVLHPRRVFRGVVAGVRDYGNRMGIPTVNGAIYFDERYVGNPLVFCGNVGLIPADKAFKEPKANDVIVAVGGRTGRDGIHGATFSSAELTSASEKESGGAVQIGNAITEKMVLDVLLKARDEGLYTAVTDCGAGGFSSAVGEMGAEIGAEVWLEKAPLKYEGLTYTEIWISEAQERMVLAVPEDKWPRLAELCQSENVEATVIGLYVPTGHLTLKYRGTVVADLQMHFLHEGRPKVRRQAKYKPRPTEPLTKNPKSQIPNPKSRLAEITDCNQTLLQLLASPNIASKEWVIRQYDHEVQGGSVIKPLVGVANDGPSDAAVLRPVLASRRGIVIACGMSPRFGDYDTYHMAASSIDEAVRNCVAVGADPSRIAILDNFCWGYTDRPETLGSLVRASLACYDAAVALGTPFISGKDSLNNEYSFEGGGLRKTIQIPPSLLISAIGQVADVSRCVTMDFKTPGNLIFLVGLTCDELGGSHLALVEGMTGGQVPTVDFASAKTTFAALHAAMQQGLVRACHDLCEGGLAVALAEMAFAGNCGAKVRLSEVVSDVAPQQRTEGFDIVLLFSESNTRFLVEVPPARRATFESALAGAPLAHIGEVTDTGRVQIAPTPGGGNDEQWLIDLPIGELKAAWQRTLGW
ncbi:MAG TPA: phosphoribosylformylglycinamidine synthase subunit PurL [Pirellulaceae bacterium]|nr:phosphoribosylformylglycinamidine synthase subunit PurL [Pirellulaceae bacterium]